MEEMMMGSGKMVLGLHLESFLMLASGVFYIICAMLLWKPFRKEGNELIGALFAFLLYQAVNMFFMGLEMQTMNMMYSNIAAIAVFIGSVYMLKLPISPLSKNTRKGLFLSSLVIVLAIFAWFMMEPERQMSLMHFVLWYDIVVNGIMVGGFMILLALKTREKVLKVKALGGGTGVVSCCIVSNGAMLGGAMITSSIFGFLAPIIILGSLVFSRKNKERFASTSNPQTEQNPNI